MCYWKYMIRYEKILLIEDDIDDQEFFSDALKDIAPQANLSIASKASDALDMLASLRRLHLPQIIFLDYNLPAMDGLDFLKALRKVDRYKAIPAIILGNALMHQEECYALGAIVCIEKPSTLEDLRDALDEVLSRNVIKEAEALRSFFGARRFL